MVAANLSGILRNLLDPSSEDKKFLEAADSKEIIEAIRKAYPVTFQEYHGRSKSEWGLARRIIPELRLRHLPNSSFASLYIRPVYEKCLFVVAENNRITGLARQNRLAVRFVRKPEIGLELVSSAGTKLDLTVDGWYSQRTKKRTVRLAETLLKKRGWNFEHLTKPFSRS